MRDRNVFGIARALPRMSWHPHNLYNLWKRSITKRHESIFTQSNLTLFQQRWIAKRLTRAYHGDFINEKIFKRWYLPDTLPDVRKHSTSKFRSKNNPGGAVDSVEFAKWSNRVQIAKREMKERENDAKQALAPVGSLMFIEVERRIDVFIFRCCFVHSVYEARRLVIHGYVKLNGKKHQNSNTRLAPGDMVSVDPSAIRFLRPLPVTAPEPSDEASTDSPSPSPSESETSSTSTTSTTPTKLKIPKELQKLTPFNPPPYSAPFLFVPPYILPSFLTCSAILVRLPTARFGYSEIPTPYEADGELMRLSWEWYSRVRPRVRKAKILERAKRGERALPEDRSESDVRRARALGKGGSGAAVAGGVVGDFSDLGAPVGRFGLDQRPTDGLTSRERELGKFETWDFGGPGSKWKDEWTWKYDGTPP